MLGGVAAGALNRWHLTPGQMTKITSQKVYVDAVLVEAHQFVRRDDDFRHAPFEVLLAFAYHHNLLLGDALLI